MRSASIRLRRLDDELSFTNQRQQVLVACYEQIGFAAVGQIEQGLILPFTTEYGASFFEIDAAAVREIVALQLQAALLGELEF